jgi:hypothetical protein
MTEKTRVWALCGAKLSSHCGVRLVIYLVTRRTEHQAVHDFRHVAGRTPSSFTGRWMLGVSDVRQRRRMALQTHRVWFITMLQ